MIERYLIDETPFPEDQPLDMGGSMVSAYSLGIIANMLSKHGHVEVRNCAPTGEEIDWRPSLCGIENRKPEEG